MIPAADGVDDLRGPAPFEAFGFGRLLVRELGLRPRGSADLDGWRALVERIKAPKPTLEIALVGKYVELQDAYISVPEALRHAAWANGVDAKVRWIDSEQLDAQTTSRRPAGRRGWRPRAGGFGASRDRGQDPRGPLRPRHTGSRTSACAWACQCAVIEFARDVLGSQDVNSTEFDMFTPYPVIDFMPDQRDLEDKGGTMRLGLYPCQLLAGSKARARRTAPSRSTSGTATGSSSTTRYRQTLDGARACSFPGLSPDSRLVEIVELRDHPWFVAQPVPPRVQVAARAPAPAVPRVRGDGARPAQRGRASADRRRTRAGRRRAGAARRPVHGDRAGIVTPTPSAERRRGMARACPRRYRPRCRERVLDAVHRPIDRGEPGCPVPPAVGPARRSPSRSSPGRSSGRWPGSATTSATRPAC